MSQTKDTGTFQTCLSMLVIFVTVLSGCSSASTKKGGFIENPVQADTAVPAEKTSPFLDRSMARDLDAAFRGNRLQVTYEISNHVVTLTGVVSSQFKRARAEQVAAAVVNVQQVVNELRVTPRQFGSEKQ